VQINLPGQVPVELDYLGEQLVQVRRTGSNSRRHTRFTYASPAAEQPDGVVSRLSPYRAVTTELQTSPMGFTSRIQVGDEEPTLLVPDESLLPAGVTPPQRDPHGIAYTKLGQLASYAP